MPHVSNGWYPETNGVSYKEDEKVHPLYGYTPEHKTLCVVKYKSEK